MSTVNEIKTFLKRALGRKALLESLGQARGQLCRHPVHGDSHSVSPVKILGLVKNQREIGFC